MIIFAVSLIYSINFCDADEGDCHAGQGKFLIQAFNSKEKANSLVEKWNPIIKLAESEKIVFPVQENNKKLKDYFGFTLDSFDNGYEFELICEAIYLE
jgi:hypothetical protein